MTATLLATPPAERDSNTDQLLIDTLLPGTKVTWNQILSDRTIAAKHQQPVYADPKAVMMGISLIRETAHGLTNLDEISDLKKQLASAGRGEGLIIQAGLCVEDMGDQDDLNGFALLMKNLGDVIQKETNKEIIHIGRVAGQLTKPRSNMHEMIDGQQVLSYRGPMIHGIDPADRKPDPRRLVDGYLFSCKKKTQLDQANDNHGIHIFSSHEALSLPYEYGLLQNEGGIAYAGSASYVWIGDRTRQIDGPHVAFAVMIANPVGVKCNASMDPKELDALIQKLNPQKELGKLALVFRMGADKIDKALPGQLDTVSKYKDSVLVMCDPMHGNTTSTMVLDPVTQKMTEKKTRFVQNIRHEATRFTQICLKKGIHPAGIHIEASPEEVTECLGDNVHSLIPNYKSLCDPCLNPTQAKGVAQIFGQTHRMGGMKNA